MGANTQVSKRCMKKIYDDDDVSHDRDYISKLPEDILGNILSRLPTKEVFRNSIVSKNWKCDWTCTNVVDFYDGYLDTRRAWAHGFAEFVDMILPSCKHLKSFRLVCGCLYDIHQAHRWISIALMHNLESLVVHCNVSGIMYPSSLLNSSSLRRLDLSCNTLNVASNNVAANLTSLRLAHLKIVVENPNTSTITFTFPVLETYIVEQLEWLDVNSVEIYAPSLITFNSSPKDPKRWGDDDYDYSYVLIAPRLATFVSPYSFPEEYNNLNGSSVVSATFHGQTMINNSTLLTKIRVRIASLLNKFTDLIELEAISFTAEVLRLGPPLHCHNKLRILKLIGAWRSELVFYMLHTAPNLKFLRMSGLLDYDEKIKIVPLCIISQLEEVEFVGDLIWEDFESQYKFAKFLLKKAKCLRKIILLDFTEERLAAKVQVMETLSGFPRCSPFLIIE